MVRRDAVIFRTDPCSIGISVDIVDEVCVGVRAVVPTRCTAADFCVFADNETVETSI
jgi:hypothetical protein